VLAEVEGSRVLVVPGGPFTLRARADRIDIGARNIVISDYKTGGLPTDKAVQNGLAPQLPLEAAIVAAGGFAHVEARSVSALRYIRATGGEPPGEEHVVDIGSVTAVADAAVAGLVRLIEKFDDPNTPYRPTQRAQFAQAARFDPYVHLARTAEWSAGDSEDEESEEP
jgi:ATP-dependent helicase/nuclease subunit B